MPQPVRELNVQAQASFIVDVTEANLQQVLEFAKNYTNEWYLALEETTRKNRQTAIVTWQEAGLGKRGLPDLIKSIEPAFGKVRAKRTHSGASSTVHDESRKTL